MQEDRKIVLVIDGYHLLHKGYYGSLKRKRASFNRKGDLINALYVFVAKIQEYINENKYYTILVTFDVGKSCWRKEIYPEYKATRKETPPDLIPQMSLVREFLTEANVPWYEKESFEGDDVMGTIASICVKLGYCVEIVSNDKDCFQLVNEHVSILRQKSAQTCVECVKEEEVFEVFGCKPSQIPDMKALIGDSSDNIKGVRGLHTETAKKLISKYKSIENIYRNLDDFDDFQKEKFLNYKNQILTNKKIATILKNVNLGRINLKPLRVNYIKYMRFLKREKMWAFIKKIEETYNKQLELRQKWFNESKK